MSFPFAKPASMTSPNGGHRRLGDYTTDLRRVLVIATVSVIVATAGVIGGVVLLQLIGRYRRVLLPLFQLHLTETGAGGNRYLSIRKRSAPMPRRIRQISCPTFRDAGPWYLFQRTLEVMQLDRISKYTCCQPRFAPNNEARHQVDERHRDKRQGARSLMSKQQPLGRNYHG